MKPTESISFDPGYKPPATIPCGEKCELLYWMALGRKDIKVLEAKRYTLKLLPEHPPIYISHSGSSGGSRVVYRPQYHGRKEGSETNLDKDDLPDKVEDQLKERFLKPPGELVSPDRCQWPCTCRPDRRYEPEAAGQGEEQMSVWIDYDEIVAIGGYFRWGGERIPPRPEELRTDDGNPIPFDSETDVLDFHGIGGNWEQWAVVRRYRVVVIIKLKYQATRQRGRCKEPAVLV